MVDHDMKKVAAERAEEHIKTNLAEYLEKGVIKIISSKASKEGNNHDGKEC